MQQEGALPAQGKLIDLEPLFQEALQGYATALGDVSSACSLTLAPIIIMQSDMQESRTSEVMIRDIDPDAVEAMLEFF